MFYVEFENKIIFVDEDRDKLALTLTITPQYSDCEILEVPEGYIAIIGTELMTQEEYQAEQDAQERERISKLYLTGADVERAIYKVKGIDFDDILELVKDNPLIDEKALRIEFKANNFYRGNLYINQVGNLLGFTSDMLDKFFDTKDYLYLTTCKLTINATPENATVTGDGYYPYGTTAHYKVECEGYVSQEGDVEMMKDEVLEVVLNEDTTDTEPTTDNEDEVETEPTGDTDANKD